MAITRRVIKTFGFVYLSPLLYGVAIKTFDLVYLFHFVYEATIKTHWLCCFGVLSLVLANCFVVLNLSTICHQGSGKLNYV